MAELDSILSGAGADALTPEAVVEKPIEQAQPAQAPAEGEEEGVVDVGGQKLVPHQALHAEKQKVKRYTEQVADFEKKLTEQNTAWERRFEQLLTKVAAPQPKQEEPKAPDFWEAPDKFVEHALTPVQEQLQTTRREISQLMAEEKHGADTVKAAYDALVAARQADFAGTEAEYQSIMRSRHPYGALVQWHERRKVTAEVGSDPAAYREKLKAEILAELEAAKGNPPANGAPPAIPATPVMPSNLAGQRNVGTRSGPAWGGPLPLNDIFDRGRPAKTA